MEHHLHWLHFSVKAFLKREEEDAIFTSVVPVDNFLEMAQIDDILYDYISTIDIIL